MAGRQNYRVTKPLLTNRWYHVALTYDQPTGKTGIYVNGEKWAGSDWGIDGFDPNSDMGFILVESMVSNGVNVHSMVK